MRAQELEQEQEEQAAEAEPVGLGSEEAEAHPGGSSAKIDHAAVTLVWKEGAITCRVPGRDGCTDPSNGSDCRGNCNTDKWGSRYESISPWLVEGKADKFASQTYPASAPVRGTYDEIRPPWEQHDAFNFHMGQYRAPHGINGNQLDFREENHMYPAADFSLIHGENYFYKAEDDNGYVVCVQAIACRTTTTTSTSTTPVPAAPPPTTMTTTTSTTTTTIEIVADGSCWMCFIIVPGFVFLCGCSGVWRTDRGGQQDPIFSEPEEAMSSRESPKELHEPWMGSQGPPMMGSTTTTNEPVTVHDWNPKDEAVDDKGRVIRDKEGRPVTKNKFRESPESRDARRKAAKEKPRSQPPGDQHKPDQRPEDKDKPRDQRPKDKRDERRRRAKEKRDQPPDEDAKGTTGDEGTSGPSDDGSTPPVSDGGSPKPGDSSVDARRKKRAGKKKPGDSAGADGAPEEDEPSDGSGGQPADSQSGASSLDARRRKKKAKGAPGTPEQVESPEESSGPEGEIDPKTGKPRPKKKPKKKAGSASTKSAAAAKGSAVKGTKGKVVARVSRNSLMGGGGWGGANFDDDIQIEDNSHAGLIKQLEDALQSKNLFVIEKAITHAKGSDDHDVEDSEAFQKCVAEADALRKKQAATEAVCHACDDFEKEVHAADFDAAKNLKPAFQKLENALKKAQQAKIDEPIALKHVNEVFDAAKGRVETREKLEKMCASADAASLKAELAKLKAAPGNLTAADLSEFAEKLEAFANVKKAEDALKAVLAKKPIVNYIDALKAAIAGLRSCGGDVGEAEKVLKQEEPKKLALDALRDAMNAVAGSARASTDSTHSSSAANDTEIASVEKALQACKKLNIVASDDIPILAEAGNWIENEKRKQQLLTGIKEFMERTKTFEKMEEIEALKALEQECGKMFKEAKEVGILEAELGDLEVRKKKLHNKVEDLKGSIRVFVRVRPFNKREEELGDHNATQRLDAQSLSVDGGDATGGKKEFTFDAAHFPGTQAEIFEDTKDLVQSAFDGYNVTIFAYGQTGAGKTYTMTGRPNDEGVVPRACREVFTIVEREKERFTFTVTIHMVELYCAKFTDLLIPKSTNGMKAPEVKVRREKDGSIQLENAAERQVQSAEGMEKAIETGFMLRGPAMRQVAATAMNSESSRSHLVTIVKLTSVNKETKQKTMGKLLMCDLAGCERIAKSEVTGQAQKEAIEINKSLTALGDVIEALTKAAPGKKVNLSLVPYRNHQLTQLMQDSLGGTAKTLMFMNCSPSSSNVDETMNSLKYAERAKKVQNTIKK
eukprot:g12035.t1